MKKYHDLHWNGEPYDPLARRGAGPEGQLYYIAGGSKVNPMTKAGTTQPSAAPRAGNRPVTATQRPAPSMASVTKKVMNGGSGAGSAGGAGGAEVQALK